MAEAAAVEVGEAVEVVEAVVGAESSARRERALISAGGISGSATITLLQDAQVVASSVADANAMFQISLSNVSAGNYIYSVYSEDSSGNRSGLLSFPVSVTAGATTNIGDISVAPTISSTRPR